MGSASAPICKPGSLPRQPAKNRVALVCFLILLTLVFVEIHFSADSLGLRWDFQEFYIVAQMIRHHEAGKLYDFATQAAYQMRYIDPSRAVDEPDLPFLYPAATAIIFLPLAWLPLKTAYAVWTLCNLGLLMATVRVLQRHLRIPDGDQPLFVALLFTPVFHCILNGQLSILVLFLYAIGFGLMREDRPLLAGCIIGLAALKFQLIVGFVAVLALRRCWSFVAGVFLLRSHGNVPFCGRGRLAADGCVSVFSEAYRPPGIVPTPHGDGSRFVQFDGRA